MYTADSGRARTHTCRKVAQLSVLDEPLASIKDHVMNVRVPVPPDFTHEVEEEVTIKPDRGFYISPCCRCDASSKPSDRPDAVSVQYPALFWRQASPGGNKDFDFRKRPARLEIRLRWPDRFWE